MAPQEKEVNRLKPGKYYKRRNRNFYVHCGIFHQRKREFVWVVENWSGGLTHMEQKNYPDAKEISRGEWKGE